MYNTTYKQFINKEHGVVPGKFNLPKTYEIDFITTMKKLGGGTNKTKMYLTVSSNFGENFGKDSVVVFAFSYT